MVPGRVLTINGAPARVLDGEELNIDREFNLTWSDTLPEDNRLVQGRWWGRDGRDEVSAEQGVARALGLKLGDRIGIQIGADRFEATLSSIRQLDWDSMRPNFFLMFPRQVLQQRAGMWLTSFYLEPGRKELLNELVREYPTISVPVSYTHLRAHETVLDIVCRLLLANKTTIQPLNTIFCHQPEHHTE